MHRFTRPDSILSSIEPDGEPQLDLDQVSIWTLLEAFDHILKATGHGADMTIFAMTPRSIYIKLKSSTAFRLKVLCL